MVSPPSPRTWIWSMTCRWRRAGCSRVRICDGINWKLGRHSNKSAFNQDPFRSRDYRDSAMPLERLKRVETPTTYMDEANIPACRNAPTCSPARSSVTWERQTSRRRQAAIMPARRHPHMPSAGHLAPSCCCRMAQQEDAVAAPARDAAWYSDQLKGASYFLGVDAVGMSRCPDWTWYSHDARGDRLDPPHDQAISMVIDQGFETMEGASGDDWISVAQSMRAYLRFSMLGGVIARQIRNLGFRAKAHTVLDGDVLQPPSCCSVGLAR